METTFDFGQNESRTVYVRSVELDELPEDLRDQIEDVTKLYAVHREDGERIAVVTDRNAAFTLARHNDLAPVAVH